MSKDSTLNHLLEDPYFTAMIDLGPIVFFRDYLASMETFLEDESQKHSENLRALEERMKLGELAEPSDPGQMPAEMEYDYYQRVMIEEFINILRKSFFVNLYAALESRLIKECHYHEERKQTGESRTKRSLSDTSGSVVQKAMTYLEKVQCINFSRGESMEWAEIQNYRVLRNCIVHNGGRLNERTRKRGKLRKFIDRKPTLSLSEYDDEIILGKGFCEEAVNTVERFLLLVLAAAASRPGYYNC